MWFEKLTGFKEKSPKQVRGNISIDGPIMTSRVNGNRFVCGLLETPTLAELRSRVRAIDPPPHGPIAVREIVADVQHLHADQSNAGALFQVASQFNLLEMVSPSVTPECGVDRYENDRTQGPACAVAAGAGTIYRNYFAPVRGRTGQTSDNQIDCLEDLGRALGNTGDRLWEMKNGYALATGPGLEEIDQRLQSMSADDLDRLRALLRIGIQWNTQVTLSDSGNTVSQAYCSALPVAYTRLPEQSWTRFAGLVLEAAYEATLCAATLNRANGGSDKVFLTMLGGGVFGNRTDWILDGMQRALHLFKDVPLDVGIVSYGASKPQVRKLLTATR